MKVFETSESETYCYSKQVLILSVAFYHEMQGIRKIDKKSWKKNRKSSFIWATLQFRVCDSWAGWMLNVHNHCFTNVPIYFRIKLGFATVL